MSADEKVLRERTNRLVRKLWLWLIFLVIIGMVPVLVDLKYSAGKKSIDVTSLFSHGELVLLALAIAADAVSDIYASGKTKGTWNAIFFGLSCAMLAFSGTLYVIIDILNSTLATFCAFLSVIIFVISIISGVICKVIAGAEK